MAERDDMPSGGTGGSTERREVTIKFGKGLVGEPFVSRAGKTLVEIKIPNQDPSDNRPWASFVVSQGMVHDNKFGKGVWMKLPEDGETKISRPVLQGQDQDGKNIWKNEGRMTANTELKAMMEAYKTKDRGSVLSDLSEKSSDRAKTAGRRENRSREAVR